MGLQTAKSMGYIDIDWNKIRDDAIKPLDTVCTMYQIYSEEENCSLTFALRNGLLLYELFCDFHCHVAHPNQLSNLCLVVDGITLIYC